MSSRANGTAVVAFVAAPHAGYLQFFRQYPGSELWILGEEFIAEFPELVKHLPRNEPTDLLTMVNALGIFSEIRILTQATLSELRRFARIVMPDENVSRAIAERHLSGLPVLFDGSVWLRWYKDAAAVGRRPYGEEVISTDELDRRLMGEAFAVAKRSPDWWRQVGALLVRDGVVLLSAFNTHVPDEQSCYLLGDPRSSFEPGERIDLSSAEHAERVIAAAALRRGICTQGCDLYVSTFPCPACAYEWAATGIKRLFYRDGYSLVEGAATLRKNNVSIIRVPL
jgi:dCMP deaminase